MELIFTLAHFFGGSNFIVCVGYPSAALRFGGIRRLSAIDLLCMLYKLMHFFSVLMWYWPMPGWPSFGVRNRDTPPCRIRGPLATLLK